MLSILFSTPVFKYLFFLFLHVSCTLITCDELPHPAKEDIIKRANGVDAIFWASKHRLDHSVLDAAGSHTIQIF